MSTHLDIRQRNNLLTGNKLAAEVPASVAHLRAFVEIWAYDADRGWRGVSKFLNADTSNLRFEMWKYEIDRSYYETDGLDWDYFIRGKELRVKDIATVDELEALLIEYVGDLAKIDNDIRIDTPR